MTFTTCVSAFVRADHLSRVGQDVNHGVLAAESLVERVKVGNTGDFGTYEPDEVFGTVFENWKTKDPEAKAVYSTSSLSLSYAHYVPARFSLHLPHLLNKRSQKLHSITISP